MLMMLMFSQLYGIFTSLIDFKLKYLYSLPFLIFLLTLLSAVFFVFLFLFYIIVLQALLAGWRHVLHLIWFFMEINFMKLYDVDDKIV